MYRSVVAFVALALFASPVIAQESCSPYEAPGKSAPADTGPKSAPSFSPLHESGQSVTTVVFLGDSLTGGNASRFPRQVARLTGSSISAYSIGGQKAQLLSRLFDDEPVPDDAVGVIWIGRNNDPSDVKGILSSIDRAASRFASKRYIVVGYLSGRYPSEQPGGTKRKQIDALNAKLLGQYGTHFMNPRPLIECNDYLDSIHLQDSGYDKIAEIVAAIIFIEGWVRDASTINQAER